MNNAGNGEHESNGDRTKPIGFGPLSFFVSIAPWLEINPSSDSAFRAAARDAVRRSATVEELQAQLRTRYPRAVVRRREIDEPGEHWYVYRDGSWISERDRDDNAADG